MVKKTYCAFCKHPRTVYDKKHITWTNVSLSLLAAVLLMFIVWQRFNPIVIVFFVLALSAAEIFTQMRWRLSVECPHCGFDPVLYLRDQTLACDKVVRVLEEKKSRGDYLLKSNNPFEFLHKRKADDFTTTSKPPQAGSQVSKRV